MSSRSVVWASLFVLGVFTHSLNAQTNPVFALKNPQPDVVRAYGAVASNGRGSFSTLSASMKGDVWTLHMQYFLEDHPDLTLEQRAVVYEGIGLLATGIFEKADSDPKWQTSALGLSLDHLTARAKAVMSAELVAAAFSDIGPPGGHLSSAFARITNLGDPNAPRASSGTCECSTVSDWCWNYCQGGFRVCTFTDCCCGTYFMYGCNGLCT